MRFFTSDPHFHHKNVIEFCARPFKDVVHMNEELIRRWNVVVGPEDTIYILDDMFFCGTTEAKKILSRLMGKKILIAGNHDWGKLKKHRAQEFGFEWIEDQHCIRLANEDVYLSHFPYRDAGDHTKGEERYADRRIVDDGSWLLHGHVHTAWKVKDRMINVGADQWSYAPVSETEIIELMRVKP